MKFLIVNNFRKRNNKSQQDFRNFVKTIKAVNYFPLIVN